LGGGGSDIDDIHNAIINAKNNGRNGKGCVIVFSSGNNNGPVSYPAKYPQVIAVGATDENDIRWSYSNYGPELDVVAPSGPILGHPRYKKLVFWTTDISGSAGYNPGNTSEGDTAGNYYKWFGGTSAATPQVAGLAALILSVNPALTSDEVQSIIESTADDKGEPGWDQYYGWGRINLYKALANMSSLPLDKVDDINDSNGVVPDDDIHYTISYGNPIADPCDPNYIGDVNDAVITDYLPDDLAFSSASGPNSVYHPGTHTVTWNIGTLSSGDGGSVTLTVKVNDCIAGYGIITNVCIIKGGDLTLRGARENTPVCSASHPSPACGEIVDLDTGEFNLTWCPGHFAADVNGHEVYFGSNFNDVNDADNSWPLGGVYKGEVNNPSYSIQFSDLDVDTTYYWRIDEVNTNHPDLIWPVSPSTKPNKNSAQ
jgi:hypothetical protein